MCRWMAINQSHINLTTPDLDGHDGPLGSFACLNDCKVGVCAPLHDVMRLVVQVELVAATE